MSASGSHSSQPALYEPTLLKPTAGSSKSSAPAVGMLFGMNALDALLEPARLWSREEVLERPSPVPRAAGIYAWYFRTVPGWIDTANCHMFDGMPMLYVGIAPKKPYKDGRRSKSTLHQRVRYHYRGNAEGSTLRLTLGCLLQQKLGIELRRVGSGRRRTFSDGENALSAWMGDNAFVHWLEHAEPWAVEEEVIRRFDVPLNLDQNKHNVFHPELSAARREAKQRAATLPILPK